MLLSRVCVPSIIFSLWCLACPLSPAQHPGYASLGVFTGSIDVGATLPGAASYDPATGTYRITGGGADMWGAADQFHFVWVRIPGDATVTAEIRFPGTIADPKEKAVLIFRQSLDPGSPYADIALHGDGHIAAQERAIANGPTTDTTSTATHSLRLQMVRKGSVLQGYAVSADGTRTASPPAHVVLHGTVYAGIGVCAHNADGLVTVTLSGVRVDQPLLAPSAR